jgi:molecular chaperone HtpG
MSEQTTEHMEFKTEVNQLLNLVVHSLYSNRDIFLRELISNASDAIDKIRYQSLTAPDLAEGDSQWRIQLSVDKAKGTLTVSDNGIGMTHEELVSHLGTIAKSGTREFLATLQENKDNINLIGQFGVGFYSSFMVADKVEVVSRAPHATAFRWVSDGQHGYEILPAEKPTRGTDVVLHLKSDCLTYLEEYEIRNLVKKYSDFVEFPIVMEVERTVQPRDAEGKPKENAPAEKTKEIETLNSQKAIWAKPKNSVSPEEYHEFYQHISHDYADPLQIIHYHAEGAIEFKALLYIPSQRPFDLFLKDAQKGLSLYINRVFIMSDAKNLIPPYLRFLKGVVDTHDLPLNVSRELLQQNPQLDKIHKNIVTKTLSTLKEMKEKEYDKYLQFYRAFGSVLKEGLHYDPERREAIAELLLYESVQTPAGQYLSLDQYIKAMPEAQKSFYYLTAEDRSLALASPYLAAYRAKGFDVLLMLEPIDEIVIPDLPTYKDKPLRAVGQEWETSDEEKKQQEEEQKQASTQHQDLLAFIQKQLEKDVKEVRFSSRLGDAPAGLASDEFGMNKSMQELWRAMGREVPEQKFVLELNPRHSLVAKMQNLLPQAATSGKLVDTIGLLYDEALLAAGLKVKDMAEFSRRLTQLMVDAG